MTHRAPRVVVIVIVLLLALFLGWRYWLWKRGEPEGGIRASGTIEATEIMIAPKTGGRIAVFNVEEGSEVKKGDLIARLDTEELQAQVNQAKAALDTAQARWEAAVKGARPEQIAQARAQLAQAEAATAGAYQALLNARTGYRKVTELKAQLDSARARYEASEAAYRQAVEALQLVREGPRAQRVAQARAALEQAEVALRKAESDYRRMEALYQQGAISEQQWEAARTARDTAQTQLDQAKARLADLEAGARPEEIRQAEMAVAQAKANLEGAKLALANAQEAYQDRLNFKTQYDAAQAAYKTAQAQARAAKAQLDLLLAGTRAEDIRAAQAQVNQAKAALKFAQAQLKNAFIYAPTNGVVKTKIAELGEIVAPGAPILTLADLDHVWLRVYVPENLYGKVKIGQAAEVRVDSYPNEVFQGKVVTIASEAEFTPKNIQTEQERVKLVFGVKIALDNREHKLKPGMPADAGLRHP